MTDFNPPRISNGTFTDKPQTAPPAGLLPKRPKAEVFTAVPANRAGFYWVESAQTNPRPVDGSYVIPAGGGPHIDARLKTIMHMYSAADRAEARAALVDLVPQGAPDQRVTILVQSGTSSGQGVVARAEIIEGMLHTYGDGAQILIYKGRGKATGYVYVDSSTLSGLGGRILAVREGYGKQRELAADFDQKAAQVPVTVPVTWDDIPAHLDSDQPGEDTVAAVFLLGSDDLANGEPGQMFFATNTHPRWYDLGGSSKTPDLNMISGHLWPPTAAPGRLVEFASFYINDTEMYGKMHRGLTSIAGRIRDYEPGSMSTHDARQNTLPDERVAAYAQVLGKS